MRLIPPSEVEGGTVTEHVLYHLYAALYYLEQLPDTKNRDVIDQYITTAMRLALLSHDKLGNVFDLSGRVRRSIKSIKD